jgi:HEAT repeat protein
MDEVQRLAASGAAGVSALVALLAEPSWVVRRAVIAALARVGTPAVAPLCEALEVDRTNESRLAAAVDALVASGGDVEPAVLALAERATTPAIVCDVAQILGRRRSQGAVAALAGWSTHEDDNVAVAALEALGRIRSPGAVEPLLAAVRSRNFFRTFPAIAVLGASGDPRAVAPLVELLREPHYAVEAATALGKVAQLAAVAPLSRMLTESATDLVRVASRALSELRLRNVERFAEAGAVVSAFHAATTGLEIAPGLKRALAGADATDTLALATVLGWLHDEAGVHALLALLDGEAPTAELASAALRGLAQEAEAAIRAAVRSGDSARRLRLLPLLGARRSVLGELTLCLGDEDAQVRALACDALGRVGDSSVVAQVFARVGDVDARVSQAAVAAVQSLGSDETRRQALGGARVGDARTRRASLRILSYFAYPEALDVLLDALTDADERIREVAASGLALLDDPRALAALVAAAAHSSAPTRAATMRAFGHGATTADAVGALNLGLRDEDAWARYYACQSLGKLRATAAAHAIEALLEDDAGQVRVAAIEALARLGGDRALAALERASQVADPDMRRAALAGLGSLSRPGALAILVCALESHDPGTRLAAVSAIAESESADAVRALIRAAADSDGRVRSAAFELLARRGGFEASRWLIGRLAEATERERAVSALAQPVDGRIEAILTALESAEPESAVWLVEALLRMRRPNGNAAAEAALQMGNVHARRAAATALVSLGNSSAQQALAQAATRDADPEVRRICAAAV